MFDTEIVRVPLLDELLTDGKLVPKFQPIIELASSRPIGFESLARHRADTPFSSPELLFEYGRRKNRVADLELACLEATLKHGAGLTHHSNLFINVHPAVFRAGTLLARSVQEHAEHYGARLDRLVLEITEQDSLGDLAVAMKSVEILRGHGVRFALDDVGMAYSHLSVIDKVEPAFLKISQDFGTGFESNPTKVKIIRNMHSLALDFGAELIIEGIETRETAEFASSMGIRFGQGYYFSRPQEVSVFTSGLSGEGYAN